jgi:hypothetical protein
MQTYSNEISIHATPQRVFAFMDEIRNTGMHMMKSSMAMMGSKLQIKQISQNGTGLHATFRWFGTMLGFPLDFTVRVTRWEEHKEKVWETVGEARLLILSWYRMRLSLTPEGAGTKVRLGIEYAPPTNLFWKCVAFVLAPLYASWCVTSMLRDSKYTLEALLREERRQGEQLIPNAF